MSVASLYRTHVTDYELEADWACLPVQIHWLLNPGSECEPRTIELVKVTAKIAGLPEDLDISKHLDFGFIMTVLEEEVSGADWKDYGNA